MPRQFNFSETVKRDARLRQMELCAYCGDSLNEQWEEAHHVVPDQSGQKGIHADDWMKSASNCVVLCDPCHANVGHDGNTKTGSVAGPEVYKYSHGGDHVQHAEWVRLLDIQAAKIWGSKLGRSSLT
jgi:5-methylcytosine-specific restriction endonuclease McrA